MPSAPIVPPNDPTLMFTNAGMVAFKEVFLGLAEPPYPRVADSQKCLRISGKHNDLEEVGLDTYHHTMFEMLGNWSFGDYYKAEAIEWAWELLTTEWQLPKDRLYATVFRTDEESETLWKKVTDIAAERVLRFDEKDNFWEMGETGPCGPCSEIHIDRGPAACDKQAVPGHRCHVNSGCARFIEIWNLVFIQYSRDESGKVHDLPERHVDTGMGLERVAALIEHVDGNYEGSLLRRLIEATERLAGQSYGRDHIRDVSFRVLADHSRAVAFLIAGGVLPANEGRGYVLRRLLRRAARHGKPLGFDEPFFYKICGEVVQTLGAAYPELNEHRSEIVDIVRAEEQRFELTLDRGLVHLEGEIEQLGQSRVLAGEVAFRLYDTYGFPLDMTEDILRSRGIKVDHGGFERALDEQRERGRDAQAARLGTSDYSRVVARVRKQGGSSFAGPFATELESRVIALCRDGEPLEVVGEGADVEIVTELTPFYAESGGQVGDTGCMTGPQTRVEVTDTQKAAPDVIVHRGRVSRGEIIVGAELRLAIDATRRQAVRLNHSGTHLLHAALRNHLGSGVQQAGSLVEAPRLRFDFSHEGPVAGGKLADVESELNEMIRANLEVETEEMPYEDAIAAGALAFFGEKYGDVVRVVRMGDYSVELCGGTHVRRTGEIGLLRLTSESGVAAGVRRIEAVTGEAALDRIRRRDALLRRISQLLRGSEEEVSAKVEKLLATVRELEKRIAEVEAGKSGDLVAEALAKARQLEGARLVVARADGLKAKGMRAVCDRIREALGSGVVVLAGDTGSGVAVTVAVTADQTSRFHAGKIIKELAPLVDGRGGGKEHFAQAGGKNPAGIGALLEKADEILGC